MPKSLEQPILKTLKRGPRATASLARAIHERPPKVFANCKKLEKRRKVSSTVMPGGRLFFFTVTGEVMNRENHDEIERISHELRTLFGKHLKDENSKTKPASRALMTALGKYLKALAKASESERQAEHISSFLRELRTAAELGESWKTTKARVGLRPFRAKARIWSLPH